MGRWSRVDRSCLGPGHRSGGVRLGSLLVLAMVGLAGCTDGDSAAPDSAPPTPVATSPSDNATTLPAPSTSGPTITATPSPVASPVRVALDEVVRHPSGVTMRMQALEVGPDGVALDVQVTNGSGQEAVLAYQASQVTMVDDTGMQLEFVPPDDNDQLRVAVGEQLAGTLSFRGRVADEATTVTVRFNYVNGEPINDDLPVSQITSFEFADLPLEGTAPGGEPTEAATAATASVDVRQQHPGGVNLEISSITTSGDAILLSVRVVNTDGNEATTLAVNPPLTWLEDDLGNRYALRPPDEEDGLRIGPGEELVGDIAFVGPVDPEATSLTLRTNHLNDRSPINLDKLAPGSVSFVVEDLPIP